jgi:glycosyltransferase involved in cell wall biosynthesis
MLVSVVVCTHSLDNFGNLREAIDSLLNQTYNQMEIVIVVDGNEDLYDAIVKAYGTRDSIEVVPIEVNIGISGARNIGAKEARGDVIAFLDDDAVADKDWVSSLVDIYKRGDAISVGGKIMPIWLAEKPRYFPEELGWLVGITHEGFAEEKVVEVRNSFGPNMSFKREVFEKIGYFNEKLGFGKRGTSYIQGEEPDFALRMKREMGKGVTYNPEALVYHKIPESKTRPRVLLRRSFYQGYTKALLKRFNPSSESLTTEGSYLSNVFFKFIPRRLKKVFSFNFLEEVKALSLLIASVLSVGLGFIYGYWKRPND